MRIKPQAFEKISTGRIFLVASLAALAVQGCAHQQTSANPPAQAASPAPAPEAAAPAQAAEAAPAIMEQAALDKLKAMSDTLGAAKALSYHSRSTVEVVGKTGQFLTHFLESDISLERPNKLRANIGGELPHFQFYYDGANVSAWDPQKNFYATASAPKTIDEMLPFVVQKTGIEFPSGDFLIGNPYAELTRDLSTAMVVGTTKINGLSCDHLAFTAPTANWEIWIQSGEKALPCRVAVTYKTAENLPRFHIEFFDWNLKPKLAAGQFAFKAPAGAKQIEFGARTEQLPQ
jgi:hypothetical protein